MIRRARSSRHGKGGASHEIAAEAHKPQRIRRACVEALESRVLLSTSSLVFPGADGRLVYMPNAAGDVIPDFSSVGYMTGTVPLPDTTGGAAVPVKQTVHPGAAGVDMTATIQNAINAVSALTPDANGFRGAVLLTAGNYPISGQLNINAGGVVLEGQGNNKTTGTALEATGTTQRFLINVNGSGSRSTVSGTTHNFIDSYVPVGATSFHVDSTTNLHVGDAIVVTRPSTANWIHDIGMDLLTNPWTPGSRDLNWDRTITAINGNLVTVNIPLTNSFDANYGGGSLHRYTWSGRISQDGVENLYAYSDSTSAADENHATGSITMSNLINGWINNVTSDGFGINQIIVDTGAEAVTVDNTTIENTSTGNSAPPAGLSVNGQLILAENITQHSVYHAVALTANVPGPNVIYNMTADGTLTETGPHQRWSTGGLFDNVHITGSTLSVRNALNEGTGHGWQGANYVFWNDSASAINVSSPPTAQNWVIGGSGTQQGNGIFDQFGTTVSPQSLYQKQLWDRTHANPTVATPASATPNPLGSATSVNLSTLGADASVGESGLTYTWSTLSKPSGAANPTFSANATNAAKNVTAALSQSGTYIFRVTIADAMGLLVTSTVDVTPAAATIINGDQDSANENDNIRIVRNGTFVDVYRNNTVTPVLHQDYASSPELILNGLGGNDTITVDYSGGNPVPAAGLIVDNGTGTSDVVSVVGSAGNDSVTLSGGGSVAVNGGQFGYVNAEELDLSLGAGADSLTVSGNASVGATNAVLNISGGGSVTMTGGSTLPDFADVNVNGATLDLAGQSQTIDSLNGNGTILTNGAAATLTVGQHNGGGTFTGTLGNGSGAGVLSLAKNGSGTLTLSGTNSYSGITTISAGTIASGNSASLAGLSGQLRFNGGTFHVTGNSTAANVSNKFTSSFTGASGSSTGTFNIDPGVTLTIGGSNAALQTNGGGSHGGDLSVTGGGTLRLLGDNHQQDNPLHLLQGTIEADSAFSLGGGDAGVLLDASGGTTLILKQDVPTNFATPIDAVDPGSAVNVVIDRQTAGAGVTHSINALTSGGAFTLNLTAGPNVTSGTAGLSVGSVTLSGDGTFAVGTSASLTVTGVISGAFSLIKTGSGAMLLNGASTYTGNTNVNGGSVTVVAGGSLASTSITVASGAILNINGTIPATSAVNDNGAVNFGGNTGTTAASRTIGTLAIGPNATASITSSLVAGVPMVLNVNTVTFAGGAKLDLTNNEVVTQTTLPAVQNSVLTGQYFSSLAGGDFAVGYMSLSGGSVEVRFTLAADANLDGNVDVSDLGILATNYGKSTGQNWSTGDFTGDGGVDVSDLGVLATEYGKSLPTTAVAAVVGSITSMPQTTPASHGQKHGKH